MLSLGDLEGPALSPPTSITVALPRAGHWAAGGSIRATLDRGSSCQELETGSVTPAPGGLPGPPLPSPRLIVQQVLQELRQYHG